MRKLRLALLVLGSAWFMPVSCTSSLVAGTHAFAALDNRDIEHGGDKPHSRFYVAVTPGEREGESFRLITLGELDACLAKQGCKLQLPKFADRTAQPYAISYQVLENSPDHQLVEAVYRSDDYSFWSRYRVSAKGVEPVSSRMFGPQYMFRALPYALLLAFLLRWLARWLLRQQDQSQSNAQ